MQPLVPGLGGTTSTFPFLPEIFALIEKLPLGVRLMLTPVTGEFSPLGSLYLNPLFESPVQNGLPVTPLVPESRANDCEVDVPPVANTSRSAPPALPAKVGLPLRVFELPFSLPEPVIFRLAESPGFCFTVSDFPRIVWSAAKARLAAQAKPATAATNFCTCRMCSPPYEIRCAASCVRQVSQ